MADAKITQLTEDTAPQLADLLITVDDPAGTPINKKSTIGNALKALSQSSENTSVAVSDMLVLIDDPAGTPAVQKATVTNVLETVNGLTEDSTPDFDADFLMSYDVSGSTVKKVALSKFAESGGGNTDGWTEDATNTWSYSSADAPTFVISINADMTTVLSIGMKLKLTQTTVKYFIVTAVGSYSGGATLITVYGGTDYTLANAAISTPYYSTAKAPVGFPMSPIKWMVKVTDTTDRSQASPTATVWYNLGSISISIPIGAWRVSYKVMLDRGTAGYILSTLSTANNSESDTEFTGGMYVGSSMSPVVYIQKPLIVAAKTSYYINTKYAAGTSSAIYNVNSYVGLVISAECAYL